MAVTAKVYKTIDGGLTWINLTTALLNNITIANIMAQYGTDGGVYIGTDAGVFIATIAMPTGNPIVPTSRSVQKQIALNHFTEMAKSETAAGALGVGVTTF